MIREDLQASVYIWEALLSKLSSQVTALGQCECSRLIVSPYVSSKYVPV